MAKTSRTMESRKRPPPTTTGGPPNSRPLPNGIDALLARYARDLPPGGTVSVQLIKGPATESVDPIAARRVAARRARQDGGTTTAASGGGTGDDDGQRGGGNDGGGTAGGGGAFGTEPLRFPRVAKFVETVTPPNFTSGSLKDGRMYEEEVPKAQDESDEEESTAYKPSNLEANGEGGGGAPADPSKANKKKRRRWRRNDPRPRRWVLQEKREFVERIRRKRQQQASGMSGTDDDDDHKQPLSQQYHGVAESNASRYVILGVAPPSSSSAAPAGVGPAAQPASSPSVSRAATERISVQPIHGFHTFSQPYKFASLSMEEAENAIEKQRNVMTRYVMHGKLSSAETSEARATLASGVGGRGPSRLGSRPLGPAPKAMSRARLLGKLAGGGGGAGAGGDGDDDDDDDDDVMGDVRYSTRRTGGSSRARRELLSSVGDEGTTADDDGVLGGANNSEFGGRRRFARVAADRDADDGSGAAAGKGGGGTSGSKAATGFEAGAMEEGFYQRDVAAEYEALDYDANEQFDDDDVNVGEDEMMDDGGGYGGDDYDSGNDNMLDSDDEGGSDDDGLGGIASASGLKAMLAKARGESPTNVNASTNAASSLPGAGGDGIDAGKNASATDIGGGEVINKMLDAAKKTAEEMEKKKSSEQQQRSETASPSPPLASAVEKDKDGKRLITLDAIRREIWLNNGAITSKRLMKKFDVTKKNPERQALFKKIVLELCTMKKSADGNQLVLKQHYAKIK